MPGRWVAAGGAAPRRGVAVSAGRGRKRLDELVAAVMADCPGMGAHDAAGWLRAVAEDPGGPRDGVWRPDGTFSPPLAQDLVDEAVLRARDEAVVSGLTRARELCDEIRRLRGELDEVMRRRDDQIVELRAVGVSAARIAEAAGMSRSLVSVATHRTARR